MTLHIISRRHDAVFGEIATVLLDGEVYAGINRWLLAALRDGLTPDDLQIDPAKDEPAEWWPGSPDEDSTWAFARLRGDR